MLYCAGLDEAGSRVHAFVKLHLLRTTVAAATTVAEGGVPVAPTPESAAAAEAAGTAGAALNTGWSLGINFGPSIPDDATTLRENVSCQTPTRTVIVDLAGFAMLCTWCCVPFVRSRTHA